MNKKLLAAAVASALAIPAVAFAQSSVTLYGTIDTGIRNQSKIVNGTSDGTRTSVTDGLHTTNRWGMTGSEDLGGGLKANFKLEGQYSSDTGEGPPASGSATGIFGRTAKVGLSSGGASFDIGKDYTVNFKEVGIYDPMSYTYTGIVPAVSFTAGVRTGNMVTAAFGGEGFNVRVDYQLGEQIGNSTDGRRVGIGGDFSVAGFTIAGAYSDAKNVPVAPASAVSTKSSTIGAKYGMGPFTFRAGWAQNKYDAGASATLDKSRLYMLGVQYAFSERLDGRLGYYDWKDTGILPAADGKRKNFIVAVDYNLSKRTTAYVEVDHNGLDGALDGTAKIDSLPSRDGTTGVGVGIAHKF
jgi:predicted porin